ncbi:fibrinogen C domain-containing protein 1-B-like [Dysidea avara]|uniref:fibrinogen C domain-containing protein 1-B-like n=1 Tax=Dysidea avara TaxID=196820 RepID=UPI00332CBBC9
MVLVDGECQTANGGPIESCCCLGYRNTYFNTKSSGVYTIDNFGGVKCSNTRVYCDTISGGGGWLVIQRRKDGSVDFNKDWKNYEDGFGALTGEFWFGLRGIHSITSKGQWELRIDYKYTNGTEGYLSYSNFKVGPATEQYPLTISGFTGITTDPITGSHSLNRMKFTTRDRDGDMSRQHNCAVSGHDGNNSGGWWYRSCTHFAPNNQYTDRYTVWLNGEVHQFQFVELKIRPIDCIM